VVPKLNAHCVGQKSAAAQNLEGCIRVAIMHHWQQWVLGILSITLHVTNQHVAPKGYSL
jgi:hypothetical protein